MKFDVNIPEIGAEMLLTYLYPELEEHWRVRNEGTFYRNYNNDSISVSPDENEVSLARDGFLKLLPQGLISPEDELLRGDISAKHKEIKRRERILKEAFIPIDTVNFRRRLKIEKEISKFLSEKLDYILDTYFNIKLSNISNPYVKELATILPFIRSRRGDFGLIKNLLNSLFECKVNVLTGRYSQTDSTCIWIPLIRYELIIEKLNNNEYKELSKGLGELKDFITEWFIPAEMKCEILIKDHREPPFVNNNLTLDYNTRIN